MNGYIRFISAAVLVLSLMCLCACGDKEQTLPQETSAESGQTQEELSAQELREELVGQWGRLDEPMHFFYEDGSCVIGGMQGTYEVDGGRSLVLTTMSGSKTVYAWAKSYTQTESADYWYLRGDEITINGNRFTKIADENTPDTAE